MRLKPFKMSFDIHIFHKLMHVSEPLCSHAYQGKYDGCLNKQAQDYGLFLKCMQQQLDKHTIWFLQGLHL